MATYLVTGGCGFIGSHLCDALLSYGHKVRVLDDLSSGSITNWGREVLLFKGRVDDPTTVAAAIEGVDGCFHLAAVSSVERSNHDWLGTHRANLSGTIAVFDAARRLGRDGPVPVVYASSAAVYGDCRRLPIGETTAPRPRSAYGADKYGAELHARVASEVHGIPTVGLRFFNVYGPRQNPHSPYSGVISIFCERLRQGSSIDIFGRGTQTRDFIYVGDVVAALLAVMDRRFTKPMVFNVCSGTQTTVLDLARIIAELCGGAAKICFRPGREGEIAHSWGDCSFLRQHVELPGPVSLRAGLSATLSWMASASPVASAELTMA